MTLLDWNLYGSSRKDNFVANLELMAIAREFERYREALGDRFTLDNLFQLMEIKAIALVAEGINDAPEFLADQIGKMRNNEYCRTIVDSLDDISELITDITQKAK